MHNQRVQGGAMSTFLRKLDAQAYGKLQVRLSGIGGGFTCFKPTGLAPSEKLLFIAAGVGITPFLAMTFGFKEYPTSSDIRLLFSARGDETKIASEFENSGDVKQVSVFDSSPGEAKTRFTKNGELFNRRINEDNIKGVESLTERFVFVEFMNTVVGWLTKNGVDPRNIRQDSFNF
ncbi:UNVERIFIED_CONTAM: hypothetical protein HDU68_004863 [Siphonaria sp. JEL0065]|nr:hypothetical protein HDU68_004863 [Siphonaria sp. JEL0065]